MPVISVEHLSKTYRLGQIGTGRFRHGERKTNRQRDAFTNDLKLWWAKMRGECNPVPGIDNRDAGNDGRGIILWPEKTG